MWPPLGQHLFGPDGGHWEVAVALRFIVVVEGTIEFEFRWAGRLGQGGPRQVLTMHSVAAGCEPGAAACHVTSAGPGAIT